MSSKKLLLLLAILMLLPLHAPAEEIRFPGREWETREPRQVGLDVSRLEEIATYLGGRGCIVRDGFLVFHWGDFTRAGDVASAVKPWYSTLLLQAVTAGLVPSLDTPVVTFEPRLGEINASLGDKDRLITFAHMANQVSCYGVEEKPGTAYDYNDWQMRLFFDTLIQKVYGVEIAEVDQKVLGPKLGEALRFEDHPSFIAFGADHHPGRLKISPRDFARFGWLYLNQGNWKGTQVVDRDLAIRAVSSPLPNSIPRTQGKQAEMIPGQGSIGSERIPDNQTDHYGSYSWAWWTNGVDREGNRHWPAADLDVFAALGHKNGQRGIAVVPALRTVVSWNDTTLGEREGPVHPLNEVFRLLNQAAGGK